MQLFWKRLMGAALFMGCVAIAGTACGDSGGDDGGDDDSGGDDGADDDDGGSSSFTCCLNGSFYECSSSAELSNCNLSNGPGSCSRDSSKDDTCNN